ncbi:TIGR03759 family integrating conjugative element protein [Vibrio mediterranei]|uniref:TIGR03759 family integrating conjugative element protein n=1 Tax=Vibrio mediterranei TaxID=689 RepID=UPI0038CDE10C
MKRFVLFFTVMVSVGLSPLSSATEIEQSDVFSSSSIGLTQFHAKEWGLTALDWQRYQSLMNSPLTYDMQKDNPVEVLAIFARNDEERVRFAALLVEFDKARTEGILALDVAYRQAWKTLYPNLQPIGDGLPKRVVLFVSQSCLECMSSLKTWRSKGVGVDVYMVDANQDDEALRLWASKAGIRQNDVENQYITLNHDTRGLWFHLAKGKSVPVALAKEGDQWSVITPP